MLDKDIPRADISLCGELQIMLFLRFLQRLRKALAVRDMQNEQKDILTDI